MTSPSRPSLRASLRASKRLGERWLWGAARRLRLADIAYGTGLGGRLADLAGRSVLLRTQDPFFAALALIEFDGVAGRIVLCPPDLTDADLPEVIATAEIDAIVCDYCMSQTAGLTPIQFEPQLTPLDQTIADKRATEWVMFTSGTSGAPKLVVHFLAGLTGAIKPAATGETPPIWGTFYDIRRYGGLQILLRGLLGEGSLIITRPGEPMTDFLARLGRHGVTHLTGTPSHWRRLLMTPGARAVAPCYVRLSGEIADQAVLDSLKAFFPGVPVGHAYASTEAGVGFEVNDGLEGFPAAFLDRDGDVEMRVVDGSLQVRSTRAASRYVGDTATALVADDGFVDSGDMVELRDDRYHFVGRRNGVINVGGLKVHPEEIEAVINRHPAVRMSLVKGRRNPITGAIVVAEVVLNDGASPDDGAISREIIETCRQDLPSFKVPAMVRFTPALAMTAGGKLERAVA